MQLKNFFLVTFSLTALALNQAYGLEERGAYDIETINSVLDEVTAPLVAESNVYSLVDMNLVKEGTDISQDKYSFKNVVVLNQVPWSQGQLRLTESTQIQVTPGTSGQQETYSIREQLQGETDVVSALRYKGQKKGEKCQQLPEAIRQTALVDEMCKFAQRLQTVSSLTDVGQVLTNFQASGLSRAQVVIQETQRLLNDPENAALTGELKLMLATAQKVKAALESMTVESDKFGRVVVTLGQVDMWNMKLHSAKLVLEEQRFAMEKEAQYSTKYGFYNLVKPEIQRYLKEGLEARNQFAIEHLRGAVRVFLGLLEQKLRYQ